MSAVRAECACPCDVPCQDRAGATLRGRPLAACVGALILGLTLVSCVTPRDSSWQRYEFSRAEMGMPFRIVLYAPNLEIATQASVATFDHIRRLNGILSDYEDTSELSQLSQTAGQDLSVRVSPHLWAVLSRAQVLSRRSHGAFDVTVGPYVQLWRRARRQRTLPRTELMEKARHAVGHEKLQLDRRHHAARLTVPGMRLDLGGIAKGYAIDEGLKVLGSHGIRSALIACGGDMAASAPPPGRRGWRIDLPPPEGTEGPQTEVAWLAHRALATSGDLYQFVEIDGIRYSHIVDPRSGNALTDQSLVTVLAPDCATADGLSTSVSVLGPEEGLRLVEGTPGVGARIYRRPHGTLERLESARYRALRDGLRER